MLAACGSNAGRHGVGQHEAGYRLVANGGGRRAKLCPGCGGPCRWFVTLKVAFTEPERTSAVPTQRPS